MKCIWTEYDIWGGRRFISKGVECQIGFDPAAKPHQVWGLIDTRDGMFTAIGPTKLQVAAAINTEGGMPVELLAPRDAKTSIAKSA